MLVLHVATPTGCAKKNRTTIFLPSLHLQAAVRLHRIRVRERHNSYGLLAVRRRLQRKAVDDALLTTHYSSSRRSLTSGIRALQRFAKTKHLELWMGPWSLEEIRAARRLEPYRAEVDVETAERLYKTWGGIPRYVLENAKVGRFVDVCAACVSDDA